MERVKLVAKVLIRKPITFMYNFYTRKIWNWRLKNKEFSIICNTCVGGFIYHKLGYQFLSPTINTWISQCDFIKLALHPKEYIMSDIKYLGRRESDGAPMGELAGPEGNIIVYFVHYASFDDGVKKWKERRERIVWDNLYFMTTDGNGVSEEEMRRYNQVKCNNKVIFTTREYPNVDDVFVLKTLGVEKTAHAFLMYRHRLVVDRFNWEDEFDPIAFLNKKSSD